MNINTAKNKMGSTADFSLIVKGYQSLIYLQKIQNNYPNDPILPLNEGTLLMASYLLFVYPKETEFDNFKSKMSIDLTIFEIDINQGNSTGFGILKRIRNAFSHGKVTFDNNSGKFTLEDWEPKDKSKTTSHFVCKVHIKDLGDFLNDFFYQLKDLKFN